MKTSPAGVLFISRAEGEVDHPYKDVAGIHTIGFGHVIRPGEPYGPGTVITHQQALDLLAKDIGWAEDAVRADVTVPLTQNQWDSLVSFTFNDGSGALKQSAILSHLNAGDYEGAAAHFVDWDHDMRGGKLVVDPVLLARRKAEAALFLKPDAPPAEDPETQAEVAAVEQEFAQQENS